MKKYEILYEYKVDKIEMGSHTLYRIRALKDFGNVKAGDIGGYIEREENLSQKGKCWIYDNAKVYDNARVCDNAKVFGSARVFGRAEVWGSAEVFGNAKVFDDAKVYGNAEVWGSAWIYGRAEVCGNAKISKANDILCIIPIGSRNDITTFLKTKDNNICVKCGCFIGTIDDFLEAVSETHKDNKHAKAYRLACELAKIQIELED